MDLNNVAQRLTDMGWRFYHDWEPDDYPGNYVPMQHQLRAHNEASGVTVLSAWVDDGVAPSLHLEYLGVHDFGGRVEARVNPDAPSTWTFHVVTSVRIVQPA